MGQTDRNQSDVAQFALVLYAEHQRSKMFSRSRGLGNASDHGLSLHSRFDLEPGFGASSRLIGTVLTFGDDALQSPLACEFEESFPFAFNSSLEPDHFVFRQNLL